MQMQNEDTGEVEAVSGPLEGGIESMTTQERSHGVIRKTCNHSRLIDNVLTREGNRTGKVRCQECGVTFDDPYRGVK